MSNGQIHLQPEMALGFAVAIWDKDEDGSASWIAWGRGKWRTDSDNLGDLVFVQDDGDLGSISGVLRRPHDG